MTYLLKINACESGRKWAESQNDYETAWEKCERGDWMLWIARKQNVDLRILTRAKVECAKLVEHLMTDERSINALRVAERFSDSLATRDELNAAADAAAHAAAHAAAYAYADAAYAAADAAADAADAYAAAAARFETLKKCADICRKYIKFEELKL